MEATYCIGNDIDVCRMFDQYLYKRTENIDLPLSMQHNNHNGSYQSNDQTFHTPSFGDEEFDIQPLGGPTATPSSNSSQHPPSSYQHQQVHPNESLSPTGQQLCNTNSYHYMSPPSQPPTSDHSTHPMGINVSGNYTNSQQSQYNTMANSQPSLMLLQSHHQTQQSQQLQQSQQQMQQQQLQQQQQSHYNVVAMRSYAQSPQANSPNGMCATPGPNPPGPHEITTTSDDSDDSTPHTTLVTGLKRSPEPIENDIPKIQKKPKPTKKKKKRDPNEPQKPVSAYALFFRDTQAAIKGQNPNTSFGEVSKIVASMWDGLDAEHKNVYKKKTETAKKEYLKNLAAYRATLVSKGAGDVDNGGGYGGGYGGYETGYSRYSPPTGIPSPPIPSSQHQQVPTHPSVSKKSQMIMTDRYTLNGQHPPSMMSSMTPPPHSSHMTQTSHIDHQQSLQQSQQHQQHQLQHQHQQTQQQQQASSQLNSVQQQSQQFPPQATGTTFESIELILSTIRNF